MKKFLDEILEQPASLKNTLEFYERGAGKDLLQKALNLYKEKRFTEILFTGMGSSYFTSYLTSCLLNEYGIRSWAMNASELLHYHFSLITPDTLLVCVSQSGESFEIVEIAQKIPENITWLAITNEEVSTLAQKGSEILLSKAGHEDMTSTKTYISIGLVQLIFGWALTGKWKDEVKSEVRQLIDVFEKLLDTYDNWLPDIMDFLGKYDFMEIIGRGPSYSSVLQGALMIKEAVRSASEGMLGGDFRHGPMEMVQEGFKAVIFAPQGKTYSQNIGLAKDIAKFGGKVLLITNHDPGFNDPDIYVFHIPVKDEYLFAIAGIVPLQFMINSFSIDAGFEPGTFAHGGKVTRKE